MKQLVDLFDKKTRLVVGLMSGTSVDGIDAVLVEISGNGSGTKLKQFGFLAKPFPSGFKEFVLRNSQRGSSDVADIARLNVLISELYGEAVRELCEDAGVSQDRVDLIGSHGQTIHHLPEEETLFDRKIRATLQIGDPSVLAKLTGIVTVGDFRVGDMALGGQGAPLVPYFDYIVFGSPAKTRALLNIGGIANITYLPKGCSAMEVLAFDTGPGNMLVDQVARRLFGKDFDENGTIAFSGAIQGDIIDQLIMDSFVKMKPPKSTGRERYGESFVSSLLQKFEDRKPEDIVATLSEFTVTAVYANYLLFLKTHVEIDELYVSGGGVHNAFMLDSLRRHFRGVSVGPAEDAGVSSDAKEAVCFAVLANELISGNPTNIPSVTGAARQTLLGKICLP